LEKLFSISSILAVSVSGENLKGYLLFLDKSHLTSDEVILAEVVAGQAAVTVDLFYFLQRVQQLAATDERIRLARDLHDGVLQSLTAIALQLQASIQLLDADPDAVRQRLEGIQDLIVQEQRDLRSFVEELKLTTLASTETGFNLRHILEQLGRTMERQWNLHVDVKIIGSEGQVPASVGREICHIVREGLVNAGRHARASAATVEVEFEDHHVGIRVSDNGRGFAFRGYYDQAKLTTMGVGPAMLKSRIAFLGGALNIQSGESGARLEVTLPLFAGQEFKWQLH
jgi:signal transduction histidine kinase